MAVLKKISAKKQALIDAKKNSPLAVGEEIYVRKSAVSQFRSNRDQSILCEIIEFNGDKIKAKDREGSYGTFEITKGDITDRWLLDIGADPFAKDYGKVRPVAFTLSSILFNLDVLSEKSNTRKEINSTFKANGMPIMETNWNPFVFHPDGTRKFYQRDFVWTLEDKQTLVESIYNGIDCGKVLVRKRSFMELETMAKAGISDLFFNDIVDGKQRLNAIKGFLEDEYPDAGGNYFSDLSFKAQHQFTENQLISYAELPENTPDETVIAQFLKLNFAGVPQSKEHIAFVKSIHSSFK